MAGKEDSAWEHRRSETPALGLDMDDHLFPWGDITGLPEFPNTSVTTDPLEFLFSPRVSDPGGLSASERYPQLEGAGDFTPAVPTLKALLPVKPSSSLPHSLTYLECGYVDPSLPLDRCRVLLPNLSSWQSHQFLCHALGYLCTGCSNWMETEPALQAHMLECEQQKG